MAATNEGTPTFAVANGGNMPKRVKLSDRGLHMLATTYFNDIPLLRQWIHEKKFDQVERRLLIILRECPQPVDSEIFETLRTEVEKMVAQLPSESSARFQRVILELWGQSSP